MLRNLVYSMIFVLGAGFAAHAQNVQVTGKVTGHDGAPLAGVTILVQGTTAGTTTGGDGMYAVSAPRDGSLAVSFIGYESQTVPVGGKTRIDIVLKEEAQNIGEVIVVAFGTAKKEAFTGSATVVKSEQIAKSQQSNIAQTLNGKVAGVQLANTSGQPGTSPSIRIRGFSSLNAGNDPLWIVDGMPYDGDLGNLNPADIESMTVLKDAASNALYGARGANGVVMVTTKKARSRDAVITLDAKWGVNARAVKDYEYITDPAMYYETHYNALKNYYLASGLGAVDAHLRANRNVAGSADEGGLGYQVYTVPAGQDFIGSNGKVNPRATLGRRLVWEGQEYWVRPDDWTDAAFRHSLRQEYNANVAKSTEDYNFYASFGYLNNEGIAYNSDMERYTARLKADVQAKPWLRLGANATYAHFTYNQINDEGADGASDNVFAYTTAVGPIYPLYIRNGQGRILRDENGFTRYDYGNGDNAGMKRSLFPNGNALSDSRLDTRQAEGNAFNGTGFFDIMFLRDFKFTFNAGVSLDETRRTTVYNPYYGQFASQKGIVSKAHSRRLEFNMQQILNYTKQLGAHNLNVMIGHEYYNAKDYGLSAAKSNMFSQYNDELAGAIVDSKNANSFRTRYNNEGYFARVMYDYDNRYFASVSFRRDASSRFHPDHRWGNFWSLGGAWILTRERFMAGAHDWLDNLKLKASVGSQGNDNIGDFRYADNYTIENANGQVSTVFNSKGAKDITWETNINFNVGTEFSLLQGLLSGGVEYFYRKTTDMLLAFPMAPSKGYSSYYTNVGDMRNSGVEFELNVVPVRRERLTWDIHLNMTHMRNRISMLPAERRTLAVEGYEGYASGSTFFGEGLPMYTFYMKKYAGVSDEGKSMWYMDKTDEQGNTQRVATTEYSMASDYLCGDPIPDLYGGFGTGLTFYGFDLSFDFTYQIGGLAYDSGYAAAMYSPANKTTGMNWHKDILRAWSPENASSDIPRLQYEDQNQNGMSDRFLTDASYLNLQNINFGYTLPAGITRKFGVEKLRIYLACENVCYWSKRRGFDPRYSSTGVTSQATYSPVRTISGGLNIQF